MPAMQVPWCTSIKVGNIMNQARWTYSKFRMFGKQRWNSDFIFRIFRQAGKRIMLPSLSEDNKTTKDIYRGMFMSTSQMQVQLNRSWFYENPEQYLSSDAFKTFEQTVGISLKNFISTDPSTIHISQRICEERSVILNEIRKQHFGFAFPHIVCTHIET